MQHIGEAKFRRFSNSRRHPELCQWARHEFYGHIRAPGSPRGRQDGKVEVTISGPDGWNGNNAITTASTYTTVGNKWSWRNIFEDSAGNYLNVESGSYLFEATFNGLTYRQSIAVDAADLMPGLTNLRVTSQSETTISAAWDPVPDARSYQVELYSVDDSLPRGLHSIYTTSSSYTFSELNLASGSDYYVAVQALASDFTAADPRIPDGQFNSSFTSLRFTLGAAVTTMQLSNISAQSTYSNNGRPGAGGDELPFLE